MKYNFFKQFFGGIFNALLLTIFMLGPQKLTFGSVTASTACRATGGVSAIYFTKVTDLDDTTPVTWDATDDYKIDEFTNATGENFKTIAFTAKTASLTESSNAPAEGVSVYTQELRFNIRGMNAETAEQLMVLEDAMNCEKVVIVAALANGSNVVMGVRKYTDAADNTDYVFEQVFPLSGTSSTSGADPLNDINQFERGYTCTIGRSAHYYTGSLSDLLVAGA